MLLAERLVVHHHHQAERPPGGVEQRRTQVGLHSELSQHLVLGEALLHSARVAARPEVEHGAAGSALEVVLEVLQDLALHGKRDRCDGLVLVGHDLRHERVLHTEHLRQQNRHGVEEVVTRRSGHALGDRAEDLLDAAPLGLVPEDPHDRTDAGVLQQVRTHNLEPAVVAALVQSPDLDHNGAAGLAQDLLERLAHLQHVVGVDEVEHRPAGVVVGAVPQYLADRGAHELDDAFPVEQHEHVPRVLHQLPEAPFTGAHGSLGFPALSHVAGVHDDRAHRGLVQQVVPRHLEVAPGGVPVLDAALDQRSHPRLGEPAGEERADSLEIVWVDEVEHILTAEQLRIVTENPLHRGAHVEDAALGVDHRHQVERVLDQGAESPVLRPGARARLAHLGQPPTHMGESQQEQQGQEEDVELVPQSGEGSAAGELAHRSDEPEEREQADDGAEGRKRHQPPAHARHLQRVRSGPQQDQDRRHMDQLRAHWSATTPLDVSRDEAANSLGGQECPNLRPLRAVQ